MQESQDTAVLLEASAQCSVPETTEGLTQQGRVQAWLESALNSSFFSPYMNPIKLWLLQLILQL